MSFWTSVLFYRPTETPPITGDALGEFLLKLDELKLTSGGSYDASIKFGFGIDEDDKPSMTMESLDDEGIAFRPVDIKWDVEVSAHSLSDLAKQVSSHKETIYRLEASLGFVIEGVAKKLERVGSPENKVDLWLHDFGLEFNPITACDMNSDAEYPVGWISFLFSGHGYLYPRTLKEQVLLMEAQPKIRKLQKLCRDTWPVVPCRPMDETIEMRRQMGNLWPYPKLDLEWDWYWGLAEMG